MLNIVLLRDPHGTPPYMNLILSLYLASYISLLRTRLTIAWSIILHATSWEIIWTNWLCRVRNILQLWKMDTKSTLVSIEKHYNDVIMGAIASQITSHTILLNRLFRRRSKKTSKLRVTGRCAGNSPDRWIPLTKGQLCGKGFHLMPSSWSSTPPRHIMLIS